MPRNVVRVHLPIVLKAALERESDGTGISESEIMRTAWLFYIKSGCTLTKPPSSH